MPGSIVTRPVQPPQPPVCGPWLVSSARFHLSTVCDQFRVAPTSRFTPSQTRLSPQFVAQLPLEHSVKWIDLSGCASRTIDWYSGAPP